MPADINYWWIAVFGIAVVLFVIWVVKHNYRDQKSLEKHIIQSELKSEKHNNADDKAARP